MAGENAAEGVVEEFDPRYVLDEELGQAVALDVAEQYMCGLIGAASEPSHWERDCEMVSILPGPPPGLHLAMEPAQVLPGEIDHRVRSALRRRRVTIVGGSENASVMMELQERFAANVRWIEAETSREPNLRPLKGMLPAAEVVFCITGAIGHAGSTKAVQVSRARGVLAICVERPGEIASRLLDLFGA